MCYTYHIIIIMNTNTTDTENSHDYLIDWTGNIIKNRYVMIKRVGRGSYAAVWTVYDAVDKKYCAIKIHNRDETKTAKKEQYFYEIIQKYNSPHIMSISRNFDHDTDDGDFNCSLMDLMACSVFDIISSNKYKNGLPFDSVIKIIYQTLLGLKHFHQQNIVHGDIKPENLLVNGLSIAQEKLINLINIDEIYKNKKSNKGKHKKKNNDQNNTVNVDREVLAKYICSKINKTPHSSENDSDSNSDSDSVDSDYTSLNIFECAYDESYSVNNCEHADSSDLSDDESVNSCVDKNGDIVSENSINNIHIKIADMGYCVFLDKIKKTKIQTKHYRPPESILKIGFDLSSDIWALGCVAYELLTGELLFNPNNYDGNVFRHHIYIMIQKLGYIPHELILNSPIKDVIFTTDMKLVKGYDNIIFHSAWNDINDVCNKNNVNASSINKLIDLLTKMLDYNPENRISVKSALQHSLFSNCNNFST